MCVQSALSAAERCSRAGGPRSPTCSGGMRRHREESHTERPGVRQRADVPLAVAILRRDMVPPDARSRAEQC
jgi:hypothetical protein